MLNNHHSNKTDHVPTASMAQQQDVRLCITRSLKALIVFFYLLLLTTHRRKEKKMQSETARLGICLLLYPKLPVWTSILHTAQESYNSVGKSQRAWGQVFTQNSVPLSRVMCPVDYH